MISVFSSPSRYTQGKRATVELGNGTKALGLAYNEPFAVRADMGADALLAADAVGRAWKQRPR